MLVSRGLASGTAGVFGGEFVAPGLAPFAGLVGGGIGKERVCGGVPAGPGKGQPVEDERGSCIVAAFDRAVFEAGVLMAAVGDAGLAEGGEGDGVAARLGEEMTAEAEHVRPAAQADVVRGSTEGPACVDEPFGVGAVWVCVQVDGGGGDAGRGVPGGS